MQTAASGCGIARQAVLVVLTCVVCHQTSLCGRQDGVFGLGPRRGGGWGSGTYADWVYLLVDWRFMCCKMVMCAGLMLHAFQQFDCVMSGRNLLSCSTLRFCGVQSAVASWLLCCGKHTGVPCMQGHQCVSSGWLCCLGHTYTMSRIVVIVVVTLRAAV